MSYIHVKNHFDYVEEFDNIHVFRHIKPSMVNGGPPVKRLDKGNRGVSSVNLDYVEALTKYALLVYSV